MFKRTLTLILISVSLFPMKSFSQSDDRKNRIAISMGANTNDAYDIAFSYHFMLHPFLGIGVGIGFYNQWYSDYSPSGSANSGKWENWRIEDSETEIERFFLNPSVILQTPNIVNKEKLKMSFLIEPGLQLFCPYAGVHVDYFDVHSQQNKHSYVSTWGGAWCFWSVKAAFNFQFHQTSIAIGYGLSDADIYSSRRNLKVGVTSFSDFYPEEDITHSLFANLSYCF